MDEIEKELKQVQLQRERLALERELARKNALGWIGKCVHAMTSVVSGIAKQIIGTLRAFARQWKLILLISTVIATLIGAYFWREQQQQEQYMAELTAFLRKECGHVEANLSCGKPGALIQDIYFCKQREKSENLICGSAARDEFHRMRSK
jgi:hypothetical protein